MIAAVLSLASVLAHELAHGDSASPSSSSTANSRPAQAGGDRRVKFMPIRQARAAMYPAKAHPEERLRPR